MAASPRAHEGIGVASPAFWRHLLLLGTVTVLAVFFGAALGLFSREPWLVLAAAGLAIAAPFIWRRPQVGLYLLVGGATLFETYRLRFPDSLTDAVPFFRSLDSLGSPLPAPFSPAEVLAIGTLGVVVLKRLAAGRRLLEPGPLLVPAVLLALLTVLAFARGILGGGDLSAALHEARGLLFLVVTAVLTNEVVRTRGQVLVLLWTVLIAIAVKGMVGMWRFLITLDGDLNRLRSMDLNTNSMFSHEESFLFAFFLVCFVTLVLFRTGMRQRAFILLFMAPVIVSLLANERRAGFAVLGIGILVAGVCATALEPSRRRLLLRVGIAVALLFPTYMATLGSSGGILGQPARAIMSVFEPDPRDLSSNQYRVIEYNNVSQTILESPIVGAGFGKPFTMYEPMPDISDSFVFWNIVPHNSLLWVWLRLGILGVFVFWFFTGRATVAALLGARATDDPLLRALGVVAVATLAGWVFWSAVDMGLVNIRLAVLVGALLAVAARAPSLIDTRQTGRPRIRSALRTLHVPEPSR